MDGKADNAVVIKNLKKQMKGSVKRKRRGFIKPTAASSSNKLNLQVKPETKNAKHDLSDGLRTRIVLKLADLWG